MSEEFPPLLQNLNEESYWPLYIRILMSSIFISLSFIGIIGNLAVILVVQKVPGMVKKLNKKLILGQYLKNAKVVVN